MKYLASLVVVLLCFDQGYADCPCSTTVNNQNLNQSIIENPITLQNPQSIGSACTASCNWTVGYQNLSVGLKGVLVDCANFENDTSLFITDGIQNKMVDSTLCSGVHKGLNQVVLNDTYYTSYVSVKLSQNSSGTAKTPAVFSLQFTAVPSQLTTPTPPPTTPAPTKPVESSSVSPSKQAENSTEPATTHGSSGISSIMTSESLILSIIMSFIVSVAVRK